MRKTEPDLQIQPGLVLLPGQASSRAKSSSTSHIQWGLREIPHLGLKRKVTFEGAEHQAGAGGNTMYVSLLLLLCFSTWETYLLLFSGTFYWLIDWLWNFSNSLVFWKGSCTRRLIWLPCLFRERSTSLIMSVSQHRYKSFVLSYDKVHILSSLFVVQNTITCRVNRDFLPAMNEHCSKIVGIKKFQKVWAEWRQPDDGTGILSSRIPVGAQL